MSTSSTKKNLIDFLWEWAENHGDWAKLLVCKVVSSERPLNVEERDEIYGYYLQAIGLRKDMPTLSIKKPAYIPSTKNIKLDSLSNVIGVNKLAPDQTIVFGKNMTVVYGENGSGKTGYGRILKSIGHSYDQYNSILCDINDKPVPQQAIINYSIDGVASNFKWTNLHKNVDLSNISFFNNNCVSISITDGRTLLVSPIGFHLFNLVTDELGALAIINQTQIDKYPTVLGWFESLHTGTSQQLYASALKSTSSVSKLEELSNFTEEHAQKLTQKKDELKNLNKNWIETEIKNLLLQSNDLGNALSSVQNGKTILNNEVWEKLKEIDVNLAQLEKIAKKGLSDVAAKNGVELFDSHEFKKFISAADSYLKALEKETYPQDNDKCIYCQQKLSSPNSLELLAAYRSLLNDDTQDKINNNNNNKAAIIKKISETKMKIVFHQNIFGNDTSGGAIQPEECVVYNASVEKCKTAISDSTYSSMQFSINHDVFIKFIQDKKTIIDDLIVYKEERLKKITEIEIQLNNEISELSDRQLFASKIKEIKSAIGNKGVVSKLIGGKTSFQTNALSRKTSEARDELLLNDFIGIFNKELQKLRKSSIAIELNFGTNKGKSHLQQKIKAAHQLSEILSEGEQKAIALAEFLTELQLESSQSPVVFDDPVNSLDHHLIDDVARRLMQLSENRQVVIFTHSILLFNSLLHEKGTAKKLNDAFDCKLYDVKSEYGSTGHITENIGDSGEPKKSIKRLRNLIQTAKSSGRLESDVSAEGYGILRSAIELGVEHQIFAGAVKRYQKNVPMTLFVQVNGAKIDEHKLKVNEIYERCCGHTNAHSNPTEVISEPKLAELSADLETFDAILTDFKN